MIICLDPGHGMGNKARGIYDSGAIGGGIKEETVAMHYVNVLRGILMRMGHQVIRTRVDDKDPCPVSRRDDIAISYRCQRMVSFHCNAADGKATGTEVFYRGENDRALAAAFSRTVSQQLGLKDRGAKTEKESQHTQLAIMDFDKCWLIELGFIDNPTDRARITDPLRIANVCEALAHLIVTG
ncbi:MAG: N-acetylmuramoyl-L-alanine amidase [Verrucomicrobiota bacterium]